MIKSDLFECKVGDKVFFTNAASYGVIDRVTKELITVNWIRSETSITEGPQCISREMYLRVNDWRNVFYYENEKDLLILRLKYPETRNDKN